MDIPLIAVFQKTNIILRSKMRERLANEKWLPSNFRPPCIGLIDGIGRLSPVSQKEISDWMGIDPSDAVSMIDMLEKTGFVIRTRDANDRRKQLLSLTKKGIELRKKLIVIGDEVLNETLAPLNEKEIETLRKLLGRVVSHHENKEEK